MATDITTIKSMTDFPDTPEGWARYWSVEMEASAKAIKKWHESGEKVIKEFLDDPESSDKDGCSQRLNFFWSTVSIMRDMLYGQIPKADVTRRFGDQDDQSARISGPLILERIVNTDIESGRDGYQPALKHALMDFLLPGFGNAWVRYEAEFDTKSAILGSDGSTLAPAVSVKKRGPNGDTLEDAVVDWIYWKDHRWSPCRVPEHMRWIAKRVPMTRDMLVKRFGPEIGEKVTLNTKNEGTNQGDKSSKDPWDRADVWEIWDKEHKYVCWWVEGFDKVLDRKPDILGLKNFWPCPTPMMANLSTSAMMPRPDYAMVQDLYTGINDLMSRIVLLEQSLRVAGVFDSTVGALDKLLKEEKFENVLIPVDSWAALAERGGLEGVVSWLPIETIVGVLDKLEQKMQGRKQLLYELTGLGDIAHGQGQPQPGASNQPDTATQIRAETRYGNVRMDAIKDEFARFASELASIRAEVMVKHFDTETLIKRSNVLFTPDADQAIAAILELKREFPNYRIEVKPEAVAAQDFAAMKQERGEFLQGLSTLLRDALPLAQLYPMVMPILLEVIKWALAGFRGSSSIEGVFDKALQQVQQMLQQSGGTPQGGQQPDPKMMQDQAKLQGDLQLIQAKAQAQAEARQADIAAEAQRQQIQTQANVQEAQAVEAIKSEYRFMEARHKAALQAEANRLKIQLTPQFKPGGAT